MNSLNWNMRNSDLFKTNFKSDYNRFDEETKKFLV